MPGYLKTSLTLPQARATVELRFPEENTSVLFEDTQPRFYSLKLTFLYVTASSGKKVSVVKNTKGNMAKTRFMDVDKYHRFFVFGKNMNEEVYAMFTSTSVESQNTLRFQSQIQPGTIVKVLNAKMEGLLKATNTPILSTIEPIIPMEAENCRQLNLPHSVETAVFKYFEFVTASLQIISATATENLCPGKLCDGQSLLENCGCTSVASKRIWALTISFSCDELQPLEDVDYGTITSHATTDVFVMTSRREMSPNATEFDTFQLDNAVIQLTESVNLNGGFIIKGWYKPSLNDEGAVQDLRKIHFCCLQPVNALNVLQSARRY